ncbi:hypothetical protein BDV96DRAFT_570935 [Lophiotrema nucula]|uniref:YCII-related domain-containing protein n=1 Tax=Lophiotrema nucula TaxID=690887 RepID=A0A6A5ZGD4_9PLEO|nr:hypothetical protein BDV96DRAFT_570935 [Lophiotrema nucula]
MRPQRSYISASRQLTQPTLLTRSFAPARSNFSTTRMAALQEWLVIAPDFEGALQKRLAIREEHLKGLKKDDESFWLWGGAMLEEPPKEGEMPKMKGSAMLIGAKTREEVVERLKSDVYVKGEVWDFSKVQIIPFKSALRKPL